jgi:hypothetical protein
MVLNDENWVFDPLHNQIAFLPSFWIQDQNLIKDGRPQDRLEPESHGYASHALNHDRNYNFPYFHPLLAVIGHDSDLTGILAILRNTK